MKVAAPDTDKVPVILEFPVIAAPPLETVKAAEDVNPVHDIAFGESNPIPYFPKLTPDTAKENMIGDTEK